MKKQLEILVLMLLLCPIQMEHPDQVLYRATFFMGNFTDALSLVIFSQETVILDDATPTYDEPAPSMDTNGTTNGIVIQEISIPKADQNNDRNHERNSHFHENESGHRTRDDERRRDDGRDYDRDGYNRGYSPRDRDRRRDDYRSRYSPDRDRDEGRLDVGRSRNDRYDSRYPTDGRYNGMSQTSSLKYYYFYKIHHGMNPIDGVTAAQNHDEMNILVIVVEVLEMIIQVAVRINVI